MDLHHRIIDRRVVSDASFYILPVHLTILIWMVMPAPYRYTGQVLYNLITEHLFRSHHNMLVVFLAPPSHSVLFVISYPETQTTGPVQICGVEPPLQFIFHASLPVGYHYPISACCGGSWLHRANLASFDQYRSTLDVGFIGFMRAE